MKIEIAKLNKVYRRGKAALASVDLCLESPSMVGLLGPNGAGKTTLMKLLVGQLLPSSGEIRVDGAPLLTQEKSFKRRLGYLPQDFGLYDDLTVWQFLDYMARLKELPAPRAERIRRCLDMTSLEDLGHRRIRTLSGGQQQRVGIAQALLNQPELLIVDEPTVGLDPQERIRFRNLFAENASRQLVILSTHIIDDIESICDRLVVLHEGVILFDGAPQDLVRRAEGHARELVMPAGRDGDFGESLQVTSRVLTPEGARYRLVGDAFPDGARPIVPSLEDAYIYCMMKRAILS